VEICPRVLSTDSMDRTLDDIIRESRKAKGSASKGAGQVKKNGVGSVKTDAGTVKKGKGKFKLPAPLAKVSGSAKRPNKDLAMKRALGIKNSNPSVARVIVKSDTRGPQRQRALQNQGKNMAANQSPARISSAQASRKRENKSPARGKVSSLSQPGRSTNAKALRVVVKMHPKASRGKDKHGGNLFVKSQSSQGPIQPRKNKSIYSAVAGKISKGNPKKNIAEKVAKSKLLLSDRFSTLSSTPPKRRNLSNEVQAGAGSQKSGKSRGRR